MSFKVEYYCDGPITDASISYGDVTIRFVNSIGDSTINKMLEVLESGKNGIVYPISDDYTSSLHVKVVNGVTEVYYDQGSEHSVALLGKIKLDRGFANKVIYETIAKCIEENKRGRFLVNGNNVTEIKPQFLVDIYDNDSEDGLFCAVKIGNFNLHVLHNDFAKIAKDIDDNLPTSVYVYGETVEDSCYFGATLNRDNGKWTLNHPGRFTNIEVGDMFEDSFLFRTIDKEFKEYKATVKGKDALFNRGYDSNKYTVEEFYALYK